MVRTVAKTGTYAAMHFVVAVAVAYALTGDWAIAISIGLIEPAVQTVAYAVHEKVWERFPWKRQKHALAAKQIQARPIEA